MAAMGGSIFVIGGRLCHKMAAGNNDSPNDIVEVDLEVLSSVLRYDIGDDAWFKCAPLGTPRFDFACTVCDDKIYVAGGQCALASARGVSSAEVYDPGRDTWEALPNMSTLRYKCVGVTWQGKVHVVGGFAGRGDSWDTMERSSADMGYHIISNFHDHRSAALPYNGTNWDRLLLLGRLSYAGAGGGDIGNEVGCPRAFSTRRQMGIHIGGGLSQYKRKRKKSFVATAVLLVTITAS